MVHVIVMGSYPKRVQPSLMLLSESHKSFPGLQKTRIVYVIPLIFPLSVIECKIEKKKILGVADIRSS